MKKTEESTKTDAKYTTAVTVIKLKQGASEITRGAVMGKVAEGWYWVIDYYL